jgi:CheY-like chemotaxis protein
MHSPRKRILCVKDNEDSSALITTVFELLNYRVVIASTSAVALLDSRLPNGTGAQLCQHIRSFDRVMTILFLSADAYPQTQAEAFPVGVQAYLTKPFDPEVVKQMAARRTDR